MKLLLISLLFLPNIIFAQKDKSVTEYKTVYPVSSSEEIVGEDTLYSYLFTFDADFIKSIPFNTGSIFFYAVNGDYEFYTQYNKVQFLAGENFEYLLDESNSKFYEEMYYPAGPAPKQEKENYCLVAAQDFDLIKTEKYAVIISDYKKLDPILKSVIIAYYNEVKF